MLEVAKELTRYIERIYGLGFRVRVGIDFGEVVFGLMGAESSARETVIGAVVNLTARVEQTAADGDIYTTSTIKDMLIGSIHKFESVGSHRLKGFDGDWPLFRIVRD